MRIVNVFMPGAILLLAGACNPGPSPEPAALATADECGALITVARQQLKLTDNRTALLHGMDRKDWRPDCDWKSAGVNFEDYRKAVGYGGIGMRGPEVTFYRPKFDSDGVVVQFERLGDISEDVFTCRLSRYGADFHISSCKGSHVDPMGTMISAEDMLKAIENR
jgi:hypothetical protein